MTQQSGAQALVTAAGGAAGKYLVVTPLGQMVWTDDPAAARSGSPTKRQIAFTSRIRSTRLGPPPIPSAGLSTRARI